MPNITPVDSYKARQIEQSRRAIARRLEQEQNRKVREALLFWRQSGLLSN